MTKNMSSTESIVRITFAVIVLMLAIFKVISGIWLIVLGIFGVAFLVTAFINFCPLYKLIGVSTAKCEAKAFQKMESTEPSV